jgi:uncharacterized membrane protein
MEFSLSVFFLLFCVRKSLKEFLSQKFLVLKAVEYQVQIWNSRFSITVTL